MGWLRFSRSNARTAAEILVAALLAYFVTRYCIQLSFQIGRLSLPSDYDDVGYLTSAQQWLNDLAKRGILYAPAGLLNQHAPLTMAIAALSFALAGPFDWPPYAANGFLLAASLLGALFYLRAEKTPLLLALLIVLCLVDVPFFHQAVTEFRPDPFAGMAIGFCVLLVFREPVFDLSRGRQFRLGLLFGVALLMKPSVFLAAGFILAAALLLSCAGFLIEQRRPLRTEANALLTALARLAAGGALVFGPYLIAQGAEILGYAYMAIFTLADVNDFNGTLAQHATFYLTGLGGGGVALGLWFWIGAIAIVTRLAIAWRVDRNRLPGLCASYAVLLIIYLVLTLTAVKHYFLGSMFYATFSLLMARDLAWLLPRAVVDVDGFDFPYGAVLLIIALGVQRGFDPAPVLVTTNPDSNYRDVVSRATLLVYQAAKDKSTADNVTNIPVTILTNTANPVRVPAIALQGSREQLDFRLSDGLYIRSADEFLALAATADIVVVGKPIGDPYPGSRIGDELQAAIAGKPEFRSLASVANGFVQIYEKNTASPAASLQR